MKNQTPDNMRCGAGTCPAVYELEEGDLTPEHMKCGDSLTCPAVYQLPKPDNRLLIIGSDANAIAKWMNDNNIRVGANETAVIIERELLANILKQE